MVSKIKAGFLLLLALVVSLAATAESLGSNESVQALYGIYSVEDIARYRGGLTTKEQAWNQLNEQVEIKDNKFLFWGGVSYEDPVYEIQEHPVLNTEGSVPGSVERYGNFYGYGQERDVIRTLNVHEEGLNEPTYVFEVVGDELWFFFDGWFYRLEKVLSNDSAVSFSQNSGSGLSNEIRG